MAVLVCIPTNSVREFQGVFKWSQKALKEVDLVHILIQSHYELSQTTHTQRTLQEDLKHHGKGLLPPSGNSLRK